MNTVRCHHIMQTLDRIKFISEMFFSYPRAPMLTLYTASLVILDICTYGKEASKDNSSHVFCQMA
jgi:hypothetical protein